MSTLEHMRQAQDQLEQANEKATPRTMPDQASAHLHTAMIHLEAAVQIATVELTERQVLAEV